MLWRNPREKSRAMIGLVAGLVVGACIPDKLNPYFWVRRLLMKDGVQ